MDDCPLRLLGHRALLAALRLWLKTARLCNMHMERTLSQINRSAPKRCRSVSLGRASWSSSRRSTPRPVGMTSGTSRAHSSSRMAPRCGPANAEGPIAVSEQNQHFFIGLTRNGRTSKRRGSRAAPESSTVSACGLVGTSTSRPLVPRGCNRCSTSNKRRNGVVQDQPVRRRRTKS